MQFKNVYQQLLELWNTYPKIEGQPALCSYYRKQNKALPITYLIFSLAILVTVVARVFIIIIAKGDIIKCIFIESPEIILNAIGQVLVTVYLFSLRRKCEGKNCKEDLNLQQRICYRMMAVCTVGCFVGDFIVCLNIIYSESSGIPVSLGWLMGFLTTLFSGLWFLEALSHKIAQLFIFNVLYCIMSMRHEEFKQAVVERIFIPTIYASLFIVAYDRQVKSNFLLKRGIKEQKTAYEKFLNKFQDPVVIIEPRRLLFSNSAAGPILGDKLEEVYQKASYIVSPAGRSLEEDIKERLATPLVGPVPTTQEKYFGHDETSDSMEFQRTLMVTIIESGFFSAEKAVGLILHDITNDLAQESKRLEDRFKNMMLYSLSHELRTPLNILQSALHLAKEFTLSKLQKECYDSGKSAWHYLRNKINDTLAYAQILTGEFALHEANFSLIRFVTYLKKIVTFLLQKKKEDITLSFTVDNSMDDEFEGDKERLEQVLFNLLQNSVKYTEKGEISLDIFSTDTEIVFEVSDTGCGIPETVASSMKSTINPEFARSAAIRNNSKGCGLGLTVSSLICRKMGGTLSVSSVFGKGSTFRFSLPKGERESSFTPLSSERKRIVPNEDCKVNPCFIMRELHPVKIKEPNNDDISVLVVDDNDFNRFVAKKMLAKFQVQVEEAENGLVALEKLEKIQSASPEDKKILILMDLDMPVMNGLDSTKKIREANKKPRPKICALTAFASESERNSCFKAGMDWFLSKPLTKENLTSLLENFQSYLAMQVNKQQFACAMKFYMHLLQGIGTIKAIFDLSDIKVEYQLIQQDQ
eukprot:TRINITY_DN64416_c1_g1_i1.p1 TRINITY_DN64416_c1_g1~~TRINITY_DN64416_c1_g1_i1.p1  ORF type:complete len:811 (-),score=92.91 TRINITY_DN64416_c1_g1_i1:1382-3814(-)